MVTYLQLDDITSVPTAHNAGMKKVLSTGHIDLTRLTQVAWGTLQPGETIPAHSHQDMEESFFFIKGSGKMVVNNQEFKVLKNIFMVIPATAVHVLHCEEAVLEFIYFGLQIY